MRFLDPDCWTLWVLAAIMVTAAWHDYRTLAIRNQITLPFILTGWLLGLLHSLNLPPDNGQGDIIASLAATAVAVGMLLPFWIAGCIGAGSVKLQMGFAAWAGAFFGMEKGVRVTVVATIAAGLVSDILATYWPRGMKDRPGLALFPTGIPQAVYGLAAMLWMLERG